MRISHISLDIPWRNRINAYAVLAPFVRECFGQLGYTTCCALVSVQLCHHPPLTTQTPHSTHLSQQHTPVPLTHPGT